MSPPKTAGTNHLIIRVQSLNDGEPYHADRWCWCRRDAPQIVGMWLAPLDTLPEASA